MGTVISSSETWKIHVVGHAEKLLHQPSSGRPNLHSRPKAGAFGRTAHGSPPWLFTRSRAGTTRTRLLLVASPQPLGGAVPWAWVRLSGSESLEPE